MNKIDKKRYKNNNTPTLSYIKHNILNKQIINKKINK